MHIYIYIYIYIQDGYLNIEYLKGIITEILRMESSNMNLRDDHRPFIIFKIDFKIYFSNNYCFNFKLLSILRLQIESR